MCIIAVSKRGVKQPSLDQIRNMFENNPDGAGYMVARNGKVEIHKGFMTLADFERAVTNEHFTEDDSVVYHFRISTQAGVKPSMTHPFPLTSKLEMCEKLDVLCSVGIAHNGIIRMTTDYRETRFSDTARFITDYMTKLVRDHDDMCDVYVNMMIDHLTNSKWALMDGATGDIVTVGKFEKDANGILFSNDTYVKRIQCTYTGKDGKTYVYYRRADYVSKDKEKDTKGKGKQKTWEPSNNVLKSTSKSPVQTTIIPPTKWSYDDYCEGYYGVPCEGYQTNLPWESTSDYR